jgi:hypothetical protein
MKCTLTLCILYLLASLQVIGQSRKTFPQTNISVEIPEDFEIKTNYLGSYFLKNNQYISIKYSMDAVPPQTLANDSALSVFLGHSPQSLQWIKDTLVNNKTCKLAKYSHQNLGAYKYFLFVPGRAKTYIICGLWNVNTKDPNNNVYNDELTLKIVLSTRIQE